MPPADKTVAVLGTGTMGGPMARNLAGAGFEGHGDEDMAAAIYASPA